MTTKKMYKKDINKAGSSNRNFVENLTFGEYVRLMLKADDITQEELAQKISQALDYSLAPFAEILLNEQMKRIDPDYTVAVLKKTA